MEVVIWGILALFVVIFILFAVMWYMEHKQWQRKSQKELDDVWERGYKDY